MTFIPTPFPSPVVAPDAFAGSISRRVPYISVSEYQFAPTAIATQQLVPGGTLQQSLASLAQVIARASGWIDSWCFHRGDGTLAASVTTDADWFKVKPDGSIGLICNFKPILAVVGVGLGPTPSQVSSMASTTAQDISIGEKTIWLPGSWNWTSQGFPSFGGYPSYNGQVYAVWQYVNGFPHMALAATANQAATSIQVTPAVPGETPPPGVYAGTQLTIHDGGNTEVVTVATTPTTSTLALASPLQYSHTLPVSPDSILVSAIPWAVEQACIHITSLLIKTRGSRAFVLPTTPGTAPPKQALAQAGALEDWEIATEMLKPFQTVYLR